MEHFLERMEKSEIDFYHEYEKLERIIILEDCGYEHLTLEKCIEIYFRKWDKRGQFVSFRELRKLFGYGYELNSAGFHLKCARAMKCEDYFVYCEMVLSVLKGISFFSPFNYNEVKRHIYEIKETMRAVVEKTGYEIVERKDDYIIVEKNSAAIVVADYNPGLADVVVEYNHYLLKGKLDEKRKLLVQIASAMEPLRKDLQDNYKDETSDFFYMVNNMNVRHNNVTIGDSKYNAVFAELTSEEQEEWYDKIYEQALLLLMLKEQPERKRKLDLMKKK